VTGLATGTRVASAQHMILLCFPQDESGPDGAWKSDG
jgi:hypothetical protein